LGSPRPPFLLSCPPTLVFWFLYPPRCLNRYIGCTVHYSIWGASVPLLYWAIYSSQYFSFKCVQHLFCSLR
jgi:hypothetical protein